MIASSLGRFGSASIIRPQSAQCPLCQKQMGWMAPAHGIYSAEMWKRSGNHEPKEPSAMEITTIGLDLAKNVFQVHAVKGASEVVVKKTLRRVQMRRLF